MSETQNCINCSTPLTGNYCSNCGQRRNVKRLSIKTFFEDYLSRLFGMDTNFLRTLRDLTISPGRVGSTFVGGNRVKYIGPVGYFFLIYTFFILTFSFLGIDIKEFLSSSSESIVSSPDLQAEGEAMRSTVMGIISNNLKILEFLIIPFLALWGMVFFKKSKLNFFEHSVNALYVQGHMVFLKMLGIFLYKWTSIVINPYLILADLTYFIWSCYGFYKTRNFKTAIKGGFLYILAFMSFILFIIIITLISVIVYKKVISH